MENYNINIVNNAKKCDFYHHFKSYISTSSTFSFYLDFSYSISVLTKMHSENLTYLPYHVITNQNFHK